MSEQISLQNNSLEDSSFNPENIADEQSYDDIIENLKKTIDSNAKAAILCKAKEKNPNYLSIIYANKEFYEIFSISESNLVGKSYDFLFSDLDIGYSSEGQLEYIRLVKAVKDLHPCSIITYLQDYKESDSKTKLKIDFSPV